MAQNRPPRPPGHHGANSGERYPNDRERIDRARRAAEALFAPKPRVAEAPTPPPVRREVVAPPVPRAPPPREVAESQAARIRTWVKYGMSVAEVAEVCGVPIHEIERVLRQA
jgi:uncharacterized small protein (DUF1192 family)